MRKSLLFLAGMLCCICLGFTQGPNDPIQLLIEKLEKFRFNYPQEKVHLHLDKPYYSIGDSIWFKAYVVNAQDNVPTSMSGILNVELINEQDSAIHVLKVPLTSGLGWGQMALTDSLAGGTYRIRAYTDWMRNFNESYFFDRTIRIGNTVSNPLFTRVDYTYTKEGDAQRITAEIRYTDIDGRVYTGKTVDYTIELNKRQVLKAKGTTDNSGKIRVSFVNNTPGVPQTGKISTRLTMDAQRRFFKDIPVTSASDSVSVQFFPEGGQLIDGQLTRVGFKAVQADGWGAKITGYISNSSGEKMINISAEHAGMGSFNLLPKASERYTAHITYKDGSVKAIPLPAVQAAGYGLSVVSSRGDNVVVRISASPSLAGNGDAVLVAQSHSLAHYVSKISFTGNVITARIPKDRFPGGILQLTLFNPAMQPVAERLAFIDYRDPLKLSITTDKSVYKSREQVKLGISALSAVDTAVLGNFSVSVVDESKVPVQEDDEVTIFSNLLLSSDLRGFIEKPNYYFADTGSIRKRHLDNLMLTQGWRRFTWKEVASETFPTLAFQPSSYLNIGGKVIWRNEPAKRSKVNLFSNNGGLVFTDTLTDAEGRFRFKDLVFNDSTTLIIQARNENNRKNVTIEMDPESGHAITPNVNAPLIDPNLDISIYDYLKNSYVQYADARAAYNIQLDPVVIQQKRLDLFSGSANRNGAGNADKTFTRDDFDKVPYMTIAQYLTGRGGVMIRNNEAWLASQLINGGPMTIFLDGMPVPQSMLSTLYTTHVKSIEVLRSPNYLAVYGVRSLNGVLVLTSRNGEIRDTFFEYAPGLITYKPKGFSIVREFYSPNYDDPNVNKRKQDLRSTIYWNPFVNTLKGTANLAYFNADGTGPYKIVVEGIASDGTLGRAVYRYNVK